MHAEAGRAVAQRRVGAGQDAHAGAVHGADEHEPFVEKRAAHAVRASRHVRRHLEDLADETTKGVGDESREGIARHGAR